MKPTAIADVVLRQRGTTEGRVISVTPRDQPWVRLDVEVSDGTALLVLVFMGRREIPGLTPGRHIRAEGTVAEVHGRRSMLNPRYSILSGVGS